MFLPGVYCIENRINENKYIGSGVIVQTGNITFCAQGKLKTAYGYIWKYKNQSINPLKMQRHGN